MSLSAQEQQALDCIEARLADSDPALAALLATFTRLTSDEKMPAAEEVRGARRPRAQALLRPAKPRWLLIAFAVIASAVLAVSITLLSRGGNNGCDLRGLMCVGTVPGHHSGAPPALNQSAIRRGGG